MFDPFETQLGSFQSPSLIGAKKASIQNIRGSSIYKHRDCAVFIKNVPQSWGEEEITESLEAFGRIVQCRKIHTRGFAFAEFSRREDAARARAAKKIYVKTTHAMVILDIEKPENAKEREERISKKKQKESNKRNSEKEYDPLSPPIPVKLYDPMEPNAHVEQYDPLCPQMYVDSTASTNKRQKQEQRTDATHHHNYTFEPWKTPFGASAFAGPQ
jgi:RNA recognition motif-containing protein